jgi:hypothetical protein
MNLALCQTHYHPAAAPRRRRRRSPPIEPRGLKAQAPSSGTVVFSHTTVVNADAVPARRGARSKATRSRRSARPAPSSRRILEPRSTTDGKALLRASSTVMPISAATLARGFNEDFGFPTAIAWRSAGKSPFPRGHADGRNGCSGIDTVRGHHGRGVHGKHRPLGGGARGHGSALRVRGVRPRRRERCRPGVRGESRQE